MLRKLTITLSVVALSGIGIAAVSAAGPSAATQTPAATQTSAVTPTSSVLYSSLVHPYSATNPPTDWWSLSFGGTNATQLGDKINLAPQSRLSGATVILDSQACQNGLTGLSCATTSGATFPVSITFTIYSPGPAAGTVGGVLALQTKTFNVPFRPSANNSTACGSGTSSIFGGSNDGTQWFDPATGSCYYGVTYAATFSNFTFAGSHVLPTTVVYGVAYSAASGPASSLNVLFSTESASGGVTVGSDRDPGNLFVAAGSGSNDLGGASGEITCSTVGTSALSFEEYNTAVGATGCGTDTQDVAGGPYEPIAFVPAVELYGSN